MIAGENEKDAIIKFADMIKQNPDTKNIRWNTVPLSNSIQKEPDKDIKKGKEYPREETSNTYDMNSYGTKNI